MESLPLLGLTVVVPAWDPCYLLLFVFSNSTEKINIPQGGGNICIHTCKKRLEGRTPEKISGQSVHNPRERERERERKSYQDVSCHSICVQQR